MSIKTPTDHNINTKTAKWCIDVILKPLSNIFNKAFPILKPGNVSHFGNFKPMLLLPQFEKMYKNYLATD